MKRYVHAILVCLMAIPLRGAFGAMPTGPREGWTYIASIGGLDGITEEHLRSLLRGHGIDCLIMGSVIYSVSVPSAKRDAAVGIIREDLRHKAYRITLEVDGKDVEYSGSTNRWDVSEPRMTYAELIINAAYAVSTDVGGMLRAPDMVSVIRTFPYVVRIMSEEREYLDQAQTTQTGHLFEIELAVKPNDEKPRGARRLFQVWDHGRHVQCLGGNEWGPSPLEVNPPGLATDGKGKKDTPNHAPEAIPLRGSPQR